MIRQFREISSWRKHDITIEAGEVFTLNFVDTLPNIFVINNPNLATLKIGVTSIPRDDSYEFKVEYNTTETIGRPIGSNNLYIYNDSSAVAKIIVFSIEKEFDPSILKNMNVSLEGYTLESSAEISGVKAGVKIPINSTDLEYIKARFFDFTNPLGITGGLGIVDIINELDTTKDHVFDMVKPAKVNGKTNLFDVVKAIQEKETLLNAENVTVNTVWTRENVTALLDDLKEVVATLKGSHGNPLYSNNSAMFNVNNTTGEPLPLHIDWLYVDGGDMDIKVDNKLLFTIKDGEKFDNFDFILPVGGTFSIAGANGKIRMKYYLSMDSDTTIYFSIGNEDFEVTNGTTWRQFAESKNYYPDQTMIWNNDSLDLALKDVSGKYVNPDSIIVAGTYNWGA